jgi:methylmalonyl-CoA mutase
MEIAKLRAARFLWARAIEAAGGGAAAQRLICHGRTTRWNKTVLDQHVNLLRATTEAFAGVVGGCTGLQVGAFDECHRTPDEFSQRLARNIQIILAEECQLGRVVDPAGGAWYVEALTRQLAEKAWALFQDIVRKGGMAAAIRDGYPQSLVEKTANDRIAAVESRRDGVIGTNLQPNLREKLAAIETVIVRSIAARPQPGAGARIALARLTSCDAGTLPAEIQAAFIQGASLGSVTAALASPGTAVPAAKKVTPRRRAEPFEALRRRSEACLARTGARPKAFLATMGPRKQHAARADFSAGFFGAGGFETIPNKGFDTPEAAAAAAIKSGAPVVVICSTDETYPVLVPLLTAALKAAAKPPVIVLAGLPATPELQQQFKAAGVDEFIHVRANCATLLASLLDKLGL